LPLDSTTHRDWFRVLADPSVQGRKRLKGNAWKGIISPRCTPAVTASVWAVEALGIEGAWVFTPQVYQDDRGAFFEAFRGGEFAADLGYRLDVAQVNCSVSRRGVIRGIHYADVPPGQAKYVTCVRGAVLDVVADLRAGSPGFGKWEAVRLDEDSRKAVFLAEGLGHGFMALSDAATVLYLCSTPYAPGREHGVNPLDPAIGISWPLEKTGDGPVLSEKDAAAPTLDEALRQGRLPRYEDCVAYAAGLRGQPVPPALD
jgi:dTDP-4-dehydrorhamnose 3,5-epimerase